MANKPDAPELENEAAERIAICKELGCVDLPGIPLRFVRDLRKNISDAHARNVELLHTWDEASLTERQELDRFRRGWGPSTPTTHQKRWQDVRSVLTYIERAYEAASPPEDSEQTTEETLDKVVEDISRAMRFSYERIQEISVGMTEKPDLSYIEGLTTMREMIANFVENGGDTPCKALAQSIRLNWNPEWGEDPEMPA